MFVLLALLLLGSFAFAFGLHTWLEKARRPRVEAGAVLRLRCASGVHRSKVIRVCGQGWLVGAPLQRDSYVPLRVGERIVVEGACSTGRYLFKTSILERDASSHALLIGAPSRLRPIERREATRSMSSDEVVLEGEASRLVDLSREGARVATRAVVDRGERVRLDLADGPVFGWVLGVVRGSDMGYESREVRIRFEH